MDNEKIIKNYLKGLEKGSAKEIIKLFSSDAIVISPLYGKIRAKNFYQDLFKDTSKSKITLKNIFVSSNNPKIAAGHFLYDWILKDGTRTYFECVDVFIFDDKGKIKELKIIYDASNIRTSFQGIKTRF